MIGVPNCIATSGKMLSTCFAASLPCVSETIRIKNDEKNIISDPAIEATFPFEKNAEINMEYEKRDMPYSQKYRNTKKMFEFLKTGIINSIMINARIVMMMVWYINHESQ